MAFWVYTLGILCGLTEERDICCYILEADLTWNNECQVILSLFETGNWF